MELPGRKPIVLGITILVIVIISINMNPFGFFSDDVELTAIEQGKIQGLKQAADLNKLYIKICENDNPNCDEDEEKEWILLTKYKKICESKKDDVESSYKGCTSESLYVEIDEKLKEEDNKRVLTSISNTQSEFSNVEEVKEYLGEIPTLEDFSETFNKNIKRILYVETKNKALDSEGFPTVRFECHIFNNKDSSYCGEFRKSSDPIFSCTLKDEETFSRVPSETNKEAFFKAFEVNEELAICSSSFGSSQVMGFNYKNLRFDSINDFYKEMQSGKEAQIETMVKYIASRVGLREELEKETPNWQIVARLYNGEGYKQNNYDVKLAQADEILDNIEIG